ncbi:MAG TPA: glucokinase [Chitinophagaceae bacterium]|nr:glucokinase [Chitinophagaceae bacterium]
MSLVINPSTAFPLAFPRSPHAAKDNIIVVAGDIGGTKTNLALYRSTNAGMHSIREQTYPSRDFRTFEEIIRLFLSSSNTDKPDRICLGIAGPVLDRKVQTTNLAWELDSGEITRETGISQVALLNDLEATSYGLAGLNDQDFVSIHGPQTAVPGNAAIIAPGTGLGEAGLYWDGSHFHPFATEGGHSDFFPRSKIDLEIYQYLQGRFGIVSWERLVSGPGLTNIYFFLRDKYGMKETSGSMEEIKGDDAGAVITRMGLDSSSQVCEKALKLFTGYLAHEATSLVLKYKATGGLFLAGGIPPRIISLIRDKTVFYDQFLQSDRMKELVESVPVKVIMNPKCALLGAAYYGAYGMPDLG